MDHLGRAGLGEFAATLLRDPSLPAAAQPDAQPKEALDAWWHFFGLLRGEAELRADQEAARQALAATNDEAAQRRLIRLSRALEALRRGEWDEDGSGDATGDGVAADGTGAAGAGGTP
jgi:DNA primase